MSGELPTCEEVLEKGAVPSESSSRVLEQILLKWLIPSIAEYEGNHEIIMKCIESIKRKNTLKQPMFNSQQLESEQRLEELGEFVRNNP